MKHKKEDVSVPATGTSGQKCHCSRASCSPQPHNKSLTKSEPTEEPDCDRDESCEQEDLDDDGSDSFKTTRPCISPPELPKGFSENKQRPNEIHVNDKISDSSKTQIKIISNHELRDNYNTNCKINSTNEIKVFPDLNNSQNNESQFIDNINFSLNSQYEKCDFGKSHLALSNHISQAGRYQSTQFNMFSALPNAAMQIKSEFPSKFDTSDILDLAITKYRQLNNITDIKTVHPQMLPSSSRQPPPRSAPSTPQPALPQEGALNSFSNSSFSETNSESEQQSNLHIWSPVEKPKKRCRELSYERGVDNDEKRVKRTDDEGDYDDKDNNYATSDIRVD